MKRHRSLAAVLVLSIACASVGTGDPVVVRAEDVKVNSQTTYERVMLWHDGDPKKGLKGHSTIESPSVYKAIESARVHFDPAWRALSEGIKTYKANRAQGKPGSVDLQALMDTIQQILDTLPVVPTGGQ